MRIKLLNNINYYKLPEVYLGHSDKDKENEFEKKKRKFTLKALINALSDIATYQKYENEAEPYMQQLEDTITQKDKIIERLRNKLKYGKNELISLEIKRTQCGNPDNGYFDDWECHFEAGCENCVQQETISETISCYSYVLTSNGDLTYIDENFNECVEEVEYVYNSNRKKILYDSEVE